MDEASTRETPVTIAKIDCNNCSTSFCQNSDENTHRHARTHVHTHTHARSCTHTHTHTHTHARAHTHTRVHTHTHTHTQEWIIRFENTKQPMSEVF